VPELVRRDRLHVVVLAVRVPVEQVVERDVRLLEHLPRAQDERGEREAAPRAAVPVAKSTVLTPSVVNPVDVVPP
jgi:hypothetical protein